MTQRLPEPPFETDWPREQAAIHAAIQALLENGEWASYEGENTERLKEELSTRFARSHVQLCCSGTLAVELALRGCRVEPDDEVIIAGYDFPGNFRAIEAVGAKAVLVDVAEDGWGLRDLNALDAAIDSRTKAIIVSHLHGDVSDVPSIVSWANDRNIRVVEDACQVPGASIVGRPLGSFGDVSILSFGGSKLLTAGRGGSVLTDDARIDQRMRIYRDRGNDAFALSELQAAVLRPQLQILDEWHARRAEAVIAAENYLESVTGIELPHRILDTRQCGFFKWGMFVKATSSISPSLRRDHMVDRLLSKGIRCGAGFFGFGSRSTNRCRKIGDLHNSRFAAESTLLVHHTMLSGGASVGQRLAEFIVETLAELNQAGFSE